MTACLIGLESKVIIWKFVISIFIRLLIDNGFAATVVENGAYSAGSQLANKELMAEAVRVYSSYNSWWNWNCHFTRSRIAWFQHVPK